MLKVCGLTNLSELTDVTVPAHIRLGGAMTLEDPMSETEALAHLEGMISKNVVNKSFIGMGYYETITPGVILIETMAQAGVVAQGLYLYALEASDEDLEKVVTVFTDCSIDFSGHPSTSIRISRDIYGHPSNVENRKS